MAELKDLSDRDVLKNAYSLIKDRAQSVTFKDVMGYISSPFPLNGLQIKQNKPEKRINAAIIGGTAGIGYNLGIFLRKYYGANVIATGTTEKSIENAKKIYASKNNSENLDIDFHTFDSEKEGQIDYLKRFISENYDGLDMLIYTPAFLNPKYFGFGEGKTWANLFEHEEDFNKCMDITLNAPLNIFDSFSDLLESREGVFGVFSLSIDNLPGYTIEPMKKYFIKELEMIYGASDNGFSVRNISFPPVLTKSSLPIMASYDYVHAIVKAAGWDDPRFPTRAELIYDTTEKLFSSLGKNNFDTIDVGCLKQKIGGNKTAIDEIINNKNIEKQPFVFLD